MHVLPINVCIYPVITLIHYNQQSILSITKYKRHFVVKRGNNNEVKEHNSEGSEQNSEEKKEVGRSN